MPERFDHINLVKWFLREKRELPWRDQPSPYAVWVSEIMLQQTQVSVVIPFFERWMKRFPSIEALAKATLDEVIKEWEGLGYYSRARNLHEGARYVLEKHQGALPSRSEELRQIKGIGDYTIGAIRSFAFHQKAAAVDGNVIRVIARYFHIEEDISKAKTLRMIRELAEGILPEKEPWIAAEALIELGATVCTRKPQCRLCPFRNSCRSYQSGVVDQIPYKSTKVKISALYRTVAIIIRDDKVLVKRGEKGKIMSDLYEFPYFESDDKGMTIKEITEKIAISLQLDVTYIASLSLVNHSFTRYRAQLKPYLFECTLAGDCEGYQWLSFDDLDKLAFSSGHRQIFGSVRQHLCLEV